MRHKDCMACDVDSVKEVIKDLEFPGYTFHVETDGYSVYLYVTYNEPDVFSGVNETQTGRRWLLESKWNSGQIVQTALKAILTSMEHRTREHFTYKGRAIFNPHHSLERLYELADAQGREEHPAHEITFQEESK